MTNLNTVNFEDKIGMTLRNSVGAGAGLTWIFGIGLNAKRRVESLVLAQNSAPNPDEGPTTAKVVAKVPTKDEEDGR